LKLVYILIKVDLNTEIFAALSIAEKREMLTEFILKKKSWNMISAGVFYITFIEQENEGLMVMVYDILYNSNSNDKKMAYIKMLTTMNKKTLIELTQTYSNLKKNKINIDVTNDNMKNSKEADLLLTML
jgi:hypothetical protein